MKEKLLFLSFLFTISNFFAQSYKADLIFKDGDTIQGYGTITKRNEIEFKVAPEDKADKWNYEIVKGVIFHDLNTSKEFEYVKLNRKQMPVLLELIYRGKVNLYQHSYTYFTSSSFSFNNFNGLGDRRQHKGATLYVKRDHETIATNLAGRFKKKCLEYFKDCQEIVEIFNSRRYLKYSIEDVVVEYNTFCSN